MTIQVTRMSDVAPGVSHPRPPVEYFRKDEWARSTLSGAQAYWHQASEQGFTFHGHRLSSLYRIHNGTRNPLRKSEAPFVSPFQKYSNPTPAKNTALEGKA